MTILATIYAFAKQYKLYLIIVGFIFVIALAAGMYSCLKPVPTLNTAETQKVTDGIRKGNIEEVKEGLAQSDVRSDNAAAEVARTDEEVKQKEQAVAEAKKNYDNWTPDEIAAEAERRIPR